MSIRSLQVGKPGARQSYQPSSLLVSVRNQLLPGVIGQSPAMRAVECVTRKAAACNASVLILGETGTGKELIASAIHQLSRRSSGRFVKVNCGALSDRLLESELFGHVRGSVVGAITNRIGQLEAADGGSIFLDEINSTSLNLQAKLVRVLQDKKLERIGDTTPRQADTRVIAASDRDLMRQVHHERFREDLYWRLNVVPIEIPALRHRREDIPSLVSFFLDHYNEINDRYVTHIDRSVMSVLQDYHWPGNIRELQNYIERAVVMSDTDELTLDQMPPCVTSNEPLAGRPPESTVDGGHAEPAARMQSPGDLNPPNEHPGHDPRATQPAVSPAAYVDRMDAKTLTRFVVSRGLAEADEEENVHASVVDQIEKELITQVLAQCGGVQTKAAARLGMNRNTLYKKIKQYELG